MYCFSNREIKIARSYGVIVGSRVHKVWDDLFVQAIIKREKVLACICKGCGVGVSESRVLAHDSPYLYNILYSDEVILFK